MLCDAGTPLGDPIELGALSTIFGSKSRGAPVTLMASKGFLGHTEPAAGVVSLTMAVTSLHNLAQFPIMHLRTLNPHVATIMGASPGSITLPRQNGALAQANNRPCTGISSFAFQGSNAHAVLEASGTVQAVTPAVVPVSWRQQRQWVLPLAHCLIKHSLPGLSSSKTTFACSLQQPALAFLWEHEVLDRSLFPGAGYFEMALAALRTLHNSSSDSAVHCLTQIAIPAPMLLSPPATAGALMLTCSVDIASQAVVIGSGHTQGSNVVHMRGHFAQLTTCAESSRCRHPVTTSEALMKMLLSEHSDRDSQTQQPGAAAQALVAPAVATAQQDTGFWHHPARFDSFLQMGQLFLDSTPDSIHVPTGVNCLSLPVRMDSAQAAYGHCHPSGLPLSTNYALADQHAHSCGHIQGMQAKVIASAPKAATEAASEAALQEEVLGVVLYELAWLAESPHKVLNVVDGSSCSAVSLCQHSPAMACANALAMLQDCMVNDPMAHMVLQGSPGVGGSQTNAFQAIAGALRTAAVESSARLSVLQTASSQGDAQPIQLSLQSTAPRADVYGMRVSAGLALMPRLLPSRAVSAPTAFSLMPQPRGALANLKPVPLDRMRMTNLQPGQVVLQVRAVGLNFRDVLNVLGMYPGDPGPPGADCAGVVTAIGAGVTNLQPGMSVFGLAAGSLGSHVVSIADTLVSLFQMQEHIDAFASATDTIFGLM